MTWLALSEVAAMAGGLLQGRDVPLEHVATDTRTLAPGALFVALCGARYDGHDFVDRAQAAGARALMVSKPVATSLPRVMVEDTLRSLAWLAGAWRRRLRASVVALTGSNGKTTTKEMIASILSRSHAVLASEGNRNNHIGVPLTLLALRPRHRVAVVEMGANHPGEIRDLCALARPDVGVVLNAGPAHLAGFGDVDGVARAKGEMFESLARTATGVVNRDDAYCDYWRRLLGERRTLGFGFSEAAEFRALAVDAGVAELRLDGAVRRCRLRLPGRHNVCNALAAAAAADAAGADADAIIAGLEAMRPIRGRLHRRRGVAGMHLIDDSYNANPGSLDAALEVLRECPGKRWLALGDMAELGADARALHAAAGARAKDAGIDRLFALGARAAEAGAAFGAGAELFSSLKSLTGRIAGQAAPDVHLLVKGSRSARMDRLVAALAPDDDARDNEGDDDAGDGTC